MNQELNELKHGLKHKLLKSKKVAKQDDKNQISIELN